MPGAAARTGTRPVLGALLAGVALLLAACAAPPGAPPPSASGAPVASGPFAAAIAASTWGRALRLGGQPPGPGWEHKTFGEQKPTDYAPVEWGGRPAIHAHSEGGNSSLRLRDPLPPAARPGRLRFSWFVPALNAQADLLDSDIDDAVARIVLSFDGDPSTAFSARDHVISELARLITGEPLPYATLMYVWDNRYPVGTLIPNPHSRRIMQLVVESGPGRLGRWVDIERDVAADFRAAFGEAPGRLVSIGLMSDANNTGAEVDAWFGPLELSVAD